MANQRVKPIVLYSEAVGHCLQTMDYALMILDDAHQTEDIKKLIAMLKEQSGVARSKCNEAMEIVKTQRQGYDESPDQ